jgi:hypothetical protein
VGICAAPEAAGAAGAAEAAGALVLGIVAAPEAGWAAGEVAGMAACSSTLSEPVAFTLWLK